MTETLLIASYRDSDDANDVLKALRETELTDKQVGMLVRDDKDRTRFKSLKELHEVNDDKAGKGAATGAAAGASGGVLWALGIAAGLLPAIGPVVGGGFIGALLASAGSGAIAGGIVGALAGLGMKDEDADFVSQEFNAGNTIVVVKNPDDEAHALDILERHDPILAPSMRRESGRETHAPM